MTNTIETSYSDFIAIVNTKQLKITFQDDSGHYELTAREGIIFYKTYVRKNGASDQLDFETNYLPDATSSFPDGSIPVTNNVGFFTKPYNSVSVLTKSECGNPTTIKSTYSGTDVQLLTIVYDADGDLQSVTVSDL